MKAERILHFIEEGRIDALRESVLMEIARNDSKKRGNYDRVIGLHNLCKSDYRYTDGEACPLGVRHKDGKTTLLISAVYLDLVGITAEDLDAKSIIRKDKPIDEAIAKFIKGAAENQGESRTYYRGELKQAIATAKAKGKGKKKFNDPVITYIGDVALDAKLLYEAMRALGSLEATLTTSIRKGNPIYINGGNGNNGIILPLRG